MNNYHKKIAKSVGEFIWMIVILGIIIVIWLHIIDGLVHKDYMQVLAWASIRMIVSLNEIEEKL